MQLLVPWSIMFSRRCCQAVLERQLLLLHCPLHRRRDDFGLSPKSKQVTSTVMIPAYSNLWTCASYSWLSIFVVGGIIEIQRFFPDTLYWWYNSPFARGCLPDAWAPSTPSFWCPVSSGLHMGEGQKGKRWMVSWWTRAASFDYSLKSKRSMHPREVWEPTSLHQGNQSLNRLLDVFFCQPRVLQCCTRSNPQAAASFSLYWPCSSLPKRFAAMARLTSLLLVAACTSVKSWPRHCAFVWGVSGMVCRSFSWKFQV